MAAAVHDVIISGALPRQGDTRGLGTPEACRVATARGVTVEPIGKVRDVLQRNRRPGRPVVSDEPAGQDRFPAMSGVQR